MSWWSNFSSVLVLGNLRQIIQLAQSYRKKILWEPHAYLLNFSPAFYSPNHSFVLKRLSKCPGSSPASAGESKHQKANRHKLASKRKRIKSTPNCLLLLQLLLNENRAIWLLSKAKKGDPGWRDPGGECCDGEHYPKCVPPDYDITRTCSLGSADSWFFFQKNPKRFLKCSHVAVNTVISCWAETPNHQAETSESCHSFQLPPNVTFGFAKNTWMPSLFWPPC